MRRGAPTGRTEARRHRTGTTPRRRHRAAAALAAVVTGALVAACGVAGHTVVPVLLNASAPPALAVPGGVSTYVPSPLPSSLASLQAAGGSCENQTLPPLDPMPPPGEMPAGSTMAAILHRGYLIAGVEQDIYGLGYLNPNPTQTAGQDSGSDLVVGLDIDIAHAIAQAIFGDPDRVHFKVITNAQRISALTAAPAAAGSGISDSGGPVDIVVSSMTINCQRAAQVAFSTAYFDAGQRVLVDKNSSYTDIESLHGRKVCSVLGSTSIPQILPYGVIPIAAVNFTDCLVLLEQNQVDAVSTDDTILEGMAAQDPDTKLVGDRFTDEPYGVAMSKSTPDLVRFVNGVLAQVLNGTVGGGYDWRSLYLKWIDPAPTVPPTPPTPMWSTAPQALPSPGGTRP